MGVHVGLENGEGSLAFCCLDSGGLERERKRWVIILLSLKVGE